MVRRKVWPFFWPPTLLLRQGASTVYFGLLVGWRHLPYWLVRESLRSMPVAAGAIGMGCIGFPAHPAWEVTAACNLHCIHCHASGGRPAPDELTTTEAKRFIEDLAEVREFRMLVYTGGEPLVRRDVFELMEHSHQLGFYNVIATNATLIDDEVARDLRRVGVVGAAVSLDAPNEEVHDFVRGAVRAYRRAIEGMRALRRAGVLLQINVTAMKYNIDLLDDLLALADELGSSIMLLYQLVPVGRGQEIAAASLDLTENERLLRLLAEKQRGIHPIVEPVAGPQYWPYLLERRGLKGEFWLRLARPLFHGCSAGRGFVYIKPNGDVWPCPFVDVFCGSVRERPFREIWETSPVLQNLRHREDRLKGKCGQCRYRGICGGCRGRALALTGDYLAADPTCFVGVNNGASTPDPF